MREFSLMPRRVTLDQLKSELEKRFKFWLAGQCGFPFMALAGSGSGSVLVALVWMAL